MKRTIVRDYLLPILLSCLLLPVAARAFYNPSTGRWLSRDPIGEKGGKSLSGFVANEPVAHIDFLGLVRPGDENWPPSPFPWPWTGCCNGQPFNRINQCCCKGRIIAKAPVETGIRTWKWVDSVSNPSNPGGAPDMHVWLTWNGSPGSVDANAVIGTGFVSSPAAGITLFGNSPRTGSSPVKLSKCDFNFKCIHRCLDEKAKYWAGQGRYTGGNCQDFVNMLLSTCMANCKGCTTDAD